jgi:hypothetical protein
MTDANNVVHIKVGGNNKITSRATILQVLPLGFVFSFHPTKKDYQIVMFSGDKYKLSRSKTDLLVDTGVLRPVHDAEGIHSSVTAYESDGNPYTSRGDINAVVEAHRLEPKRKAVKPSAGDLAVLAAYVALGLQQDGDKSVRLDALASFIAVALDQKHLCILKAYFCGASQTTPYRNFSSFMKDLAADPTSGVIGKVQDPGMTAGFYRYVYPGD